MRDGWFMTGDMATRNEAGSLRLVGRKSTDLIKSGGYRIGAGEIEGALLEHPAVAEVAVTAKPDEDLGERIVAWVVLEPGRSAEPDELSAHVANLLTRHKRPREVHFVDALPRNAMGKVMKRELAGIALRTAGRSETPNGTPPKPSDPRVASGIPPGGKRLWRACSSELSARANPVDIGRRPHLSLARPGRCIPREGKPP